MLYRVAEACKAEYLRILSRMRIAEFVYVDETGMRVEAANQWLWIFRSNDEILVAIRPSRGEWSGRKGGVHFLRCGTCRMPG